MKNTTFRKKALLSSVCMLLVALVALGSATFAWFTSSTSATASNLGAKTTKSSELRIAKADLKYGDTIDYKTPSATLRPTTSVDSSSWYKSEAASKSNYASDGTYTAVGSSETNNYYFVEMLNIKNFGETTCEDITITVSADFDCPFARLAIVPVTDQTEADKMPSATAGFKSNIYGAAAGDVWTPYDLSDDDDNNKYTTKAVNTEINVDDLAANEVASYKIYLWFEGEDEDCYDTNAVDLSATNIQFVVAGASKQA